MTAPARRLDFTGPDFRQVPPAQLVHIWPKLEPMIARGLRYGQGDGTTTAAMMLELAKDNFLLWVAMDGDEIQAAIVLSIRPQATGRKLWVEMLVGSDMDSWADGLESLLSEFRDLTGSRCLEASCRPGLARYLKKRGWREKATIMEF